jgi:hypothetical protein
MTENALPGPDEAVRNGRPGATVIAGINLRLAMSGSPTFGKDSVSRLAGLAGPMFSRQKETMRLLANYLCPADWRIDRFINEYLYDTGITVKLPSRAFVLDSPGLARDLSFPADRDEFRSRIVQSYRLRQGVLHNPASDRRTTQGVFHVAEGGLPIPDDKLAVPKITFGRLLLSALNPPSDLLRLPFTSSQNEQAECFVSLLMRPLVCPAVPGFIEEKTMETRFFAPGNLVSNLDFVESIFGNAGDPFLPENDAALDVEHWTGTTGCVILAPHLVHLTKKEVGLPHWDDASERQRKQGMCWKEESELYNNGSAFKVTTRDHRGVIVTVIADNYFGYCKKEVKTQISYSANLFGLCEEEHAGGAIVFPSYDLGEEFDSDKHVQNRGYSFEDMVRLCGDAMDVHPEGYAVDKRFPDIIYVPEYVHFDLRQQELRWSSASGERRLKMLADKIYVRPSGYRVRMEQPPGGRAWRLIGTMAEGTLCHKPCTVSGGGKSEISKSITDAILQGPVFVANFEKDFAQVQRLLRRDYSNRFKDPKRKGKDKRGILGADRSLGSVIKLFTTSESDYTKEFNKWLESLPQNILELLFVVKRFYKPEWGEDWLSHFTVDIINGTPGNELKCDGRKLVSNFLRVGYDENGAWRVFGLRKDFHPAAKLQTEDDITASVVVPAEALKNLHPDFAIGSVKIVKNCESRLFQRPDEAVHKGYDKQTESDLSQPGNFLSNFEPLRQADALALVEDSIGLAQYTAPMRNLINEAAHNGHGPPYFACSSQPRLVDGKPSKNPRYLQVRPDLVNPRDAHLADMCVRLVRRVPLNEPAPMPVNSVMPGRRNNPPDREANIRSLAVFNPIHYFELPELFMEFISSMTGKSPSTTGAGSEGALTKGPFNALPPIIDLNAALVSYVLTGHDVFVSAAAWVGPKVRMDHDISLLIPEVWSRMTPAERRAKSLIENGYFEKCEDRKIGRRKVFASRLGYRMTERFVHTFFGRVFNYPNAVFTKEMLRPELQDLEIFADGVDNIVSTHQRVARSYFEDGSVEMACPPLKALLHIMAKGHWEGLGLPDRKFRALFDRQTVLASDWYRERLEAKQKHDIDLWRRHTVYLEKFLKKESYCEEAARLGVKEKLQTARDAHMKAKSGEYLKSLIGTLGLEPLKPL